MAGLKTPVGIFEEFGYGGKKRRVIGFPAEVADFLVGYGLVGPCPFAAPRSLTGGRKGAVENSGEAGEGFELGNW